MSRILKEKKTAGYATYEGYLWVSIQETKFFHTAESTISATWEWVDRTSMLLVDIFGG